MNNGHLSFAFTTHTAGSVNDELRVCYFSVRRWPFGIAVFLSHILHCTVGYCDINITAVFYVNL